MRLTLRRRRFELRLESLESRIVLSETAQGPWPLAASTALATVLVHFKSDANATSVASLLSPIEATLESRQADGSALVVVSAATTDAALAALRASDLVAYAESDRPVHTDAITPNDPRFNQLWGLKNVNNVDIDAPQAWSVTTGNPSTIIAVIDTGIDTSSPEFAGRLWTNTTEVAGNGVDDDHNGYVDDIHGWNFVSNTSDITDDEGHGTHVSGTIGANGNNGIGVTGVNWNAKIMVLKALDSQGSGSLSGIVSAIYYAVQNGARVINASWGGGGYSQSLRDAIVYAGQRNVVFVAAAGNDGVNVDTTPEYPASYHLSNMLTVAAIDRTGALASFSNYGAATVDVAAPGVDVVSTIPGGLYASYSGTSMATPHVTGVVSLVLGLHPEYTATQVVNLVRGATKPLASLTGKTAGGLVSAALAVGASTASTPTTTTPVNTPATVGTSGMTSLAIGSTADQVHASIIASDEYTLINSGSVSGFVTGLYRDLLGRDADSSGLASWSNLINIGFSRLDVISAIQNSPEAERTKVARWYQQDLGRTATLNALKSDPGVIAWANSLAAGTTDNTARAAILGSLESWSRLGSDPSNYVQAIYATILGRSADTSGYATNLSALNSGLSTTQVAYALLGSLEARQTEVATWFQNDLQRATTTGQTLDQLKNDPGVIGWSVLIGTA